MTHRVIPRRVVVAATAGLSVWLWLVGPIGETLTRDHAWFASDVLALLYACAIFVLVSRRSAA